MKNKTKFLSIVFSIIMLSVLLFASSLTERQVPQVPTDASINYYSDVCRTIVRADGTIEPMECAHNLLTNAGKNAIRDSLAAAAASTVAFDYIALCNASAGVSAGCNATNVADTGLYTEYTAGGLQRAQATYLALQNGNWSYSKTFIATADNMITNKTGIFNVSTASTPTMLAVNTFTTSTLQTNDQITINWSIWVA